MLLKIAEQEKRKQNIFTKGYMGLHILYENLVQLETAYSHILPWSIANNYNSHPHCIKNNEAHNSCLLS